MDSGLSESIVARAFIGIAKNFISTSGFLESLFSFFVARVLIRVKFHSFLPISFLNGTLIGFAFYAENFIIVLRHELLTSGLMFTLNMWPNDLGSSSLVRVFYFFELSQELF